MAFNVNERVRWASSGPNDDPSETHGTVIEVVPIYRVRFDSGELEACEESDLEYDD